jgi:hypothetical protein
MKNFKNNNDGKNWDVTIFGTQTAQTVTDELTAMMVTSNDGEYSHEAVEAVLAERQLADGPGGVDGIMLWLRNEEGESKLAELRAEFQGYENEQCVYRLWAELDGTKINLEID